MKRIAALFLFIFLMVPAASQAVALGGLNETAQSAGIQNSVPESPEAAIAQIIGQVLSFVGVLFLGLMIWAGFLWMTAAGNEEKVAQAKKVAVAAVIGLIIVALAYAITRFIGESFMAATPSL